MSYLTCPSCGLTVFDRNPLTSPRRCPRCAGRSLSVDLERVARIRDRAAELLRRRHRRPAEGSE